jgi:hypothetical protein
VVCGFADELTGSSSEGDLDAGFTGRDRKSRQSRSGFEGPCTEGSSSELRYFFRVTHRIVNDLRAECDAFIADENAL